MKLGLALPHYPFSVPGQPLSFEVLAGWAERAEGLGFSSLFVSDHLSLSIEKYGGEPGDHRPLEPLVTVAALARRVTQARLGVLALAPPLRPPAVLAKQLATLSRLVPGRLVVALGAGWLRTDFESAGRPMPPLATRVEQLEESLDVVSAVLDGGPVDYRGAWHQIDGAVSLPPADPRPVLWVAGGTDALVDLAGRKADGWNAAWRWTPEAYAPKRELLLRACEQAGRDPASVECTVGLYALVSEDEPDLARRYRRLQKLAPAGVLAGTSLDEFRADRLVGTVDQVTEQLARWAELGVTTVVAAAGGVPFSVTVPDDLELLASALPQE